MLSKQRVAGVLNQHVKRQDKLDLSALSQPKLTDPTLAGDTVLGPPLKIQQVATLVGCSPWTVRQKLIPKGLPHFRSTARGQLRFFEGEVVRWIQSQQRRIKIT
jgi:hypothetical protein